MDLCLTPEDLEIQRRARAFVDEHLLPYEMEVEENNEISQESFQKILKAAKDADLLAINHSRDDGGTGMNLFQQLLVEEQFGRATGGLWWIAWRPALPLHGATEEQKNEYLRPACRGERFDAVAVTEEGAGSDPSAIQTTARKQGGDYVLKGEKWFVTGANIADFLLVFAYVDGDPAKPAIFIVDKDLPGVRTVRTPKFMHNYVVHHPIIAFEDVRVPQGKLLGEIGEGFDLVKDWFTEARLEIGAHTLGASARALELALAWAKERVTFGKPLIENQAISFTLADMATQLAAAKSFLYRVGWQATFAGSDRKQIHALAAALKLNSSETEMRIVDKAVQIFGGRGYMREYAVERLYREARVERIWEGSSEMLRLIISRELTKRGPDVYTGWTC